MTRASAAALRRWISCLLVFALTCSSMLPSFSMVTRASAGYETGTGGQVGVPELGVPTVKPNENYKPETGDKAGTPEQGVPTAKPKEKVDPNELTRTAATEAVDDTGLTPEQKQILEDLLLAVPPDYAGLAEKLEEFGISVDQINAWLEELGFSDTGATHTAVFDAIHDRLEAHMKGDAAARALAAKWMIDLEYSSNEILAEYALAGLTGPQIELMGNALEARVGELIASGDYDKVARAIVNLGYDYDKVVELMGAATVESWAELKTALVNYVNEIIASGKCSKAAEIIGRFRSDMFSDDQIIAFVNAILNSEATDRFTVAADLIVSFQDKFDHADVITIVNTILASEAADRFTAAAKLIGNFQFTRAEINVIRDAIGTADTASLNTALIAQLTSLALADMAWLAVALGKTFQDLVAIFAAAHVDFEVNSDVRTAFKSAIMQLIDVEEQYAEAADWLVNLGFTGSEIAHLIKDSSAEAKTRVNQEIRNIVKSVADEKDPAVLATLLLRLEYTGQQIASLLAECHYTEAEILALHAEFDAKVNELIGGEDYDGAMTLMARLGYTGDEVLKIFEGCSEAEKAELLNAMTDLIAEGDEATRNGAIALANRFSSALSQKINSCPDAASANPYVLLATQFHYAMEKAGKLLVQRLAEDGEISAEDLTLLKGLINKTGNGPFWAGVLRELNKESTTKCKELLAYIGDPSRENKWYILQNAANWLSRGLRVDEADLASYKATFGLIVDQCKAIAQGLVSKYGTNYADYLPHLKGGLIALEVSKQVADKNAFFKAIGTTVVNGKLPYAWLLTRMQWMSHYEQVAGKMTAAERSTLVNQINTVLKNDVAPKVWELYQDKDPKEAAAFLNSLHSSIVTADFLLRTSERDTARVQAIMNAIAVLDRTGMHLYAAKKLLAAKLASTTDPVEQAKLESLINDTMQPWLNQNAAALAERAVIWFTNSDGDLRNGALWALGTRLAGFGDTKFAHQVMRAIQTHLVEHNDASEEELYIAIEKVVEMILRTDGGRTMLEQLVGVGGGLGNDEFDNTIRAVIINEL